MNCGASDAVTERAHVPDKEVAADRQPIQALSQDDLLTSLGPLLTANTVIVCLGSELHGDDAAGVAIARDLAGDAPWPVIEAGLAPESFVVKIAERQPDTVIVIDAVDFGGPPGAVALVDVERVANFAAGSHGPGAAPFFDALQLMHRCDVVALGIQPLETRVGDNLSPPVRQAVARVVGALRAPVDNAGP